MKLVSIVPSDRKGKKFKAVFEHQGSGETKKTTTTHFGASGYRDFTLMSNPESKFYIKNSGEREKVRQAYLRRHAKEDWMKPMTAGALSRWILWEKRTVPAAVRAFRKKFSV